MRWSILAIVALAACRREEKKPPEPTKIEAPAIGTKIALKPCTDKPCELLRAEGIRIAVSGTGVFFSLPHESGHTQLVELKGNEAKVIATSQDDPWHMFADERALYWTHSGKHVQNQGYVHSKVLRLDRKSGAITALAEEQDFATTLVADATHVYWLNYGDAHPGVFRVRLDGGKPEAFATMKGPSSVALTEQHVFYASVFVGGGTFRRAKDGQQEEQVSEDGAKIASDRTEAFGAINKGYFNTEIVRLATTGKAVTLGKVEEFGSIALDDKRVYIGSPTVKSIIAFARDGSRVETVVKDAGPVDDLAIAGDYLFWTTGDQLGRTKRPK